MLPSAHSITSVHNRTYQAHTTPLYLARSETLNAPDIVAHDGEAELALLIVESLHLESVQPADIEPDAALFGEGLGLDSLDMLELSMAIEKKYAVKLRSDDPDNDRIFASLRSLAQHIREQRAR